MITIKEIIENINELELEFDIFNSRILEFAKSTNNGDIDIEQLEKYIISLEKYKNISTKYKVQVNKNISDNNKEEYKAQKEIVTFRLNKLDQLFENNLKKLKLLLDSIYIKKEISEDIDVDFNSSNEMLEINQNLYDFYNIYNKNLEYQSKYNKNITLNNIFESKVEKELTSLKLIKIENKYMSDLNLIFEEFELLSNEFNISFKKLIKYQNITFINFDKLNDFYYPKNGINYINKIFDNQLKHSYEMKDFNVAESDLIKDFKKFKKIIKKELKHIDFLTKFNAFARDLNDFKFLDRNYEIFKNSIIFEDTINIFNDINKGNFSSVSEIINFLDINYYKQDNKTNGINVLIKNINIFDNSFELLKKYNSIYTSKSDNLDYGFFNNLFSIISSTNLSGEAYIKKGLNNIKDVIISEFNIGEQKSIPLHLVKLNSINNIVKRYILRLNRIQIVITNINNNIKNINYSGSYGLSNYKKKNNKKLLLLNSYLLHPNNSSGYISIKNHLNSIITQKFNSSKKAHIASQQRSSSRSSYSSSSRNSSSSSYSSGSSSFSSSYSSSGSSSW